MGNDLHLLGIPASDMRVRSVEEVDEMLSDIRELRREWGRRGGLESSRRADAQAAEMDSSGRLLGVHLRFLGIGSNDRRELSEQEVEDMLAAFRELSREWGRRSGLESSRRADAQAAEMDSSGRLLGVHLRFLGIGSNDRRELSEQEVEDMLAAFRELSREAGRESNRLADAQAAEMDSSGRLLGVHLWFLRIGSNDRRVLSRRDVDEMLVTFRELSREDGLFGAFVGGASLVPPHWQQRPQEAHAGPGD